MRVSQKALYALEALLYLAYAPGQTLITTHKIAVSEGLPKKFLGLILLELKHASIVESARGANGGYRLKRSPAEISLSEVIRIIDGPLAPFGDTESLRVKRDKRHIELFRVLVSARNVAAAILDHTSLADVCHPQRN
ncbi:MAG: Rrf2 family transcriptional regulator [Candidatus Acidiferrales bacterium]